MLEGRDPVIASVMSATLLGARGYSVQVEVHVGRGLPGFLMLGPVRNSLHPTPLIKGRAVDIVHELSQGALAVDQLVQRLSAPISEVVAAVGALLQLTIIAESDGWLELSGSMLVSGKEHR